ncbi:MAG: hypothetical protein K6G80_05905 [Treponema sp.]|nr:hypothetical protein [Treponema sp.]
MKSKHVKAFSFGIIVVFLIAILQLVLGVVSDRSSAPKKTDSNFDMLMTQISNAAGRYEPGSPEFSHAFMGIMQMTPDIEELTLTLDGMPIYSYPAVKAEESDTDVQSYTRTTRTAQGRTLAVKVALRAYRPFSIYYRARISFLLILAGTIATIILIMYLRLDSSDSSLELEADEYAGETVRIENDATDGSQAEEASSTEQERSIPEASSTSDEEKWYIEAQNAMTGDAAEEEVIDSTSLTGQPDTEKSAEDASAVSESTGDSESTAGASISATASDSTGAAEISAESAEPAEPEFEEPVPPAYQHSEASPVITLSLEEELDAILSASVQAEEDVSLFIVKLLVTDSATVSEIKSILESKIGHAGIVVEYNNGLAAVIKNTNLDAALATAESMLRQLESGSCLLGISSRFGRTITARRMITEADLAAAHADVSSPVIAFRVDLEKYNKYLQENA